MATRENDVHVRVAMWLLVWAAPLLYVPWFTFLLSAELAAALFPGFPRDALSSGGVTPGNGAA